MAAYTRLMLHTCRSQERDADAAMDGYAFVLGALREDGCRRLRAYRPDDRTRFTTWLVVVTRRLVLDHRRHRYGRARSDDDAHRADHAARRQLVELVAAELDVDAIGAPEAEAPDARIRRGQILDALRKSVARLDPRDRLLLALRFEDERPAREIAATLGLPTLFHVYRRLTAVLATLRTSLAEAGVDSAEP